jgi:Tfp pilus assembly protein PilX
MKRLSRLLHHRGSDEGVALITVMLVVLIITGLTATAAAVSIDNRRNANSDRISGSALGAADAGIARAIEYIRGSSIGALTCPEAAQATCTNQPAGWASPSSPQQIPLSTNGCTSTSFSNCATVYITAVTPFNPPAVTSGTYAIHSLGKYGSNPGSRDVVVEVSVTPDTFPIGVFGQTVSGNGGTQIFTESLFTTGCVSSLDDSDNIHGHGTSFSGIDAFWDQPASAHSTVGLSTGNHSACPSNDSNRVPPGPGSPSNGPSASNCPNNTVLNADQSPTGGLVSATVGSACYHQYQRNDGTWYPDGTCPSGATSPNASGLCDTTAFSVTDLQRYGYRPRGLSDAQYAALKARAQASGTYNISTGSIASALTAAQTAGISNPVLYWDNGDVSIKANDFPTSFQTAPVGDAGACASNLPIVTIVVEHHSVTFQGGNNQWIDAAFFVPDGSFQGHGGYNVYGTLFSNNLDLGSSQTWQLDNCWVQDFPGAVLQVTVKSFRENDLADLQ